VRSAETSTLLYQLFERYYLEGALMPDLLEEFTRETIAKILQKLPVDQRLQGLSHEELIKRLSLEERLQGLSAEELLAALSPEIREALARRLKENGAASNPGA
jgi:hypothetical protein